MEKFAPPFYQFSWVWLQLKKIIYLFLYISFFSVYLGTHLNNIGEKLLYYHSYHEEASFYLYVCLQLSNSPFIVF